MSSAVQWPTDENRQYTRLYKNKKRSTGEWCFRVMYRHVEIIEIINIYDKVVSF